MSVILTVSEVGVMTNPVTLPNPVSGDSLQIQGTTKLVKNGRGESNVTLGGLKKATLVWSFDSVDQTTLNSLKTFLSDTLGYLIGVTDWRGEYKTCIITNSPTFVRRNSTDYSFSLELEWLLML